MQIERRRGSAHSCKNVSVDKVIKLYILDIICRINFCKYNQLVQHLTIFLMIRQLLLDQCTLQIIINTSTHIEYQVGKEYWWYWNQFSPYSICVLSIKSKKPQHRYSTSQQKYHEFIQLHTLYACAPIISSCRYLAIFCWIFVELSFIKLFFQLASVAVDVIRQFWLDITLIPIWLETRHDGIGTPKCLRSL